MVSSGLSLGPSTPMDTHTNTDHEENVRYELFEVSLETSRQNDSRASSSSAIGRQQALGKRKSVGALQSGPKKHKSTLSESKEFTENYLSLTLKGDLCDSFSKLCLGPLEQKKSLEFMHPFPVDIWNDILEFIHEPRDLLSLARASTRFYDLSMPHLYRSISIKRPRDRNIHFVPDGLIPLDELVQKFTTPSSKLYRMGRYVRYLSMPKWTSLRFPLSQGLQGPPQMPLQMSFNGPVNPMFVQSFNLHSARPATASCNIPPPMQTLLANTLENDMKNLQSFSYVPHMHSPKLQNAFSSKDIAHHRTIAMNRGHLRDWNTPFLTPVLLAALKGLRLRSLAIDMEDSDPHLVERIRALGRTRVPPIQGYNANIDGFLGFQKLVNLDFRGVSAEERFKEIASVVECCLKSGHLKTFQLTAEEWWYVNLQQTRQVCMEKDLKAWVMEIWRKCFYLAEISRAKDDVLARPIKATLNFGPTAWEFINTLPTYQFSTTSVTALSVTNCPPRQISGLLNVLSADELPQVKSLSVEADFEDVDKFLRRLRKLRELYIFVPGLAKTQIDYEALTIKTPADAWDHMPNAARANSLMDTISRRHLSTLTTLVLEHVVHVPTGAACNNLEVWKKNGGNLQELGMCVWGPAPFFNSYLGNFPRLHSIWLFNPLPLHEVVPVGGMPVALQCTYAEKLTIGVRQCNAANLAAMVASMWGKKVLHGEWDGMEMLPHERWMAFGPIYAGNYANWRWLWKEHYAAKYKDYKIRPQHFAPLPWGPKADRKIWEERGQMFRRLREQKTVVYANPYEYES